jgi:hypothetical protein
MADGMIILSEAFPGVTHDARIFEESNTSLKLEQLLYPDDDGSSNEWYHIFGDKGYVSRGRRLLSAFLGNALTADQSMFNNIMSGLRVSVENIMAKQTSLFKLIDYHKTQKLQQCPLVQQYTVSMFLVNCHSCLYGNQVSSTFGMSPPSLERYLEGFANEF